MEFLPAFTWWLIFFEFYLNIVELFYQYKGNKNIYKLSIDDYY